MGGIKTFLTAGQREAPDQGLPTGKTHAFGTPCQLVLLREQGRSSVEAALMQACAE